MLESQINGIVVDSVPSPNKDGDFTFFVTEEYPYPETIVKYDVKIHSSNIAFLVSDKGYVLDVSPGAFDFLEQKQKSLGCNIYIYPRF